MPTHPLLERPAHPRKLPNIVGHFACRVSASVFIDELPVGWHAHRVIVELTIALVFYEIKNMRMRPGEFIFGLLTERVVPDDPVARHKPKLVGYHFHIRRVLIANRDIKRAVRLENIHTRRHPVPRPVYVIGLLHLIVILVVFITDIERRISEHQINKWLAHL